MTDDAALRAIDLSVGYRSRRVRRVVLEHLNVYVRSGELVCLLGPNGIGKSTLLRTLARMQPAMSGCIELGGCDLRRLHQMDLARRLGVVLTERPIVGALTAAQVVEFGRYPHSGWFGTLTERDHEVVRRAIEAVGAQHLANCDYSKLSDGERQRILIARALAQEPLMLLLDEPTAFLDVPSRVELMGLLRRLARDEHLAVVASTHDLELALRTADTLWLITPDGRLHAGAPEDVVVDGRIEEAFRGETIRFSPEEQTFRLVTGDRGEAVVHGGGLRATLARAVLEREGFAVVSTGDAVLTVVADGASGWQASFGDRVSRGERFTALASFVRDLPTPRKSENRT
jgi:iron complex transport system ATP-binding protein